MEINISPKKTSAILLTIIAIFVALHIAQLAAYYIIGDPDKFDFIELFDLDYEGNLPSLYSMLAILLCSAVLCLIASAKRKKQQPYILHWQTLAWTFLFLGFDEGAALHEQIGVLMERIITPEGYLYFPWVIPYTGLVILLAVFYFRFVLELPRPTLLRFIIAGGLFLSGAVGLELIGANEAGLNGTNTLTYSILYTFEEIFEMIGIVIFLRTLLEYYSAEFGDLSIRFSK